MNSIEQNVREHLGANGWPQGLQDTLLRSMGNSPIRFFILDDSGSMASGDGRRLVNPMGTGGKPRL